MNTKKNKTTEKKYILSADLPFGNLKKDTIFTYNAITKVASFPMVNTNYLMKQKKQSILLRTGQLLTTM